MTEEHRRPHIAAEVQRGRDALRAARAKELSRLEQFRGEADYNRFFVFSHEGAEEEVQVAERFCADCEAFLARAGWLTEGG